jgi:hypothetical protein
MQIWESINVTKKPGFVTRVISIYTEDGLLQHKTAFSIKDIILRESIQQADGINTNLMVWLVTIRHTTIF